MYYTFNWSHIICPGTFKVMLFDCVYAWFYTVARTDSRLQLYNAIYCVLGSLHPTVNLIIHKLRLLNNQLRARSDIKHAAVRWAIHCNRLLILTLILLILIYHFHIDIACRPRIDRVFKVSDVVLELLASVDYQLKEVLLIRREIS